ncbi:hypothetical protein ES703_44640 [subsurface metagenome]
MLEVHCIFEGHCLREGKIDGFSLGQTLVKLVGEHDGAYIASGNSLLVTLFDTFPAPGAVEGIKERFFTIAFLRLLLRAYHANKSHSVFSKDTPFLKCRQGSLVAPSDNNAELFPRPPVFYLAQYG